MASAFIGLTMLVTLNSPPGAQLRGTVSSVEPGQSLTLRNVTNPKNGMYLPEFTIRAVEITELVEDNSENIAPVAATPPPDILPQKKKTFEDPAILSMGRRPTPSQTMSRSGSARTSRAPEELAAGANPPPNVVEIMRRTTLQEKPAAVPLQIPDELDTAAEVLPEQPLTKTRNGAKSRRKKGRNAKIEDSARDPEVIPAKETTRSKGWRQTPLLEPNPSFQPFSTLRRQKGRASGKTEENGWQTEDATDVQDMGDFDFASSLAKFDKQTVFQHLQEEDGIAAEDRLVAHNRLPKFKPGTSRGKNLHHTENVLDTPNGAGASKVHHELWTSEDETKEPLGGTGSGRQSRRAESRVAIHRKPTSRKGSSVKGATIVAPQLTRANTLNNTTSKSSFFLREFDRRCETISALQMLNLENIADNEVGLSEDMMSENAGRGIAEVAISALNPGVSGLVQGKTTTPPTVVVFAGNNKNGLRAVAAGRHLRNHGFSVITCVLGLEREAELLVGLRRQLKVFRGFGGKLVTKNELLELVKALPLPIDLIIDGLLGLTMSFEELRTGDQATVYELIEWANRSTASVLAIDVPTGIDPTTGKINIIDGRQLYIHSKYIVAMGAPKKGLLEAMALGEGVSNEDGLGKGKEWQLFVADLGLGTAVWKKAGTKIRRGVEFEGSWVLGMRFQPGSE